MLARRLTTILPAMSLAEALETTRIHSVTGLTGARTALVTTRPRRAPHHTFSAVGLISGGQVPMSGHVPLAHYNRFVLDALPTCRRHVLAGLCQPLRMPSPEYNFPRITIWWSWLHWEGGYPLRQPSTQRLGPIDASLA